MKEGQGEDKILALAEQFYSGSSPPNACISVDFLCLSPGDQAVVPVRFDKPTPACDFMVAPLPDSLAVVDALPGPCSALVTEMSLCVENTSVVDVTLERGDVVATVMVDAAEGPGKGPGEGPGKDPDVEPGGAVRREAARPGAASVSGAAPKWRALVIALLFCRGCCDGRA